MRNLTDKLLSRGTESLSDKELVAAIVSDGADDERALQTAHELLEGAGGSLAQLSAVELPRLRMMAGLGVRRAMRLKAAMEFGRRVAMASATSHDTITSDGDVVAIMQPSLGSLPYEECWVLYLASSGRIIERMRISQGGVQATVVDHRLIIKRALELLAVQMVLVHNHPSGSAQPSSQDNDLTERVAEACRLFDIRLLDHVIIARGAHFSYRAHNLIK